MSEKIIRNIVKDKHLIISVDDFRKSVLSRIPANELFTAGELQAFPPEKSIKSLAGRYLIKKCFFDLLAVEPNYNQVELLNNEMGKPEIKLSDELQLIIHKKSIHTVSCSMSHSRSHASGMIAIVYDMMMPDFKTISWYIENGIGYLMLNQPPANSMNKQFFEELKLLHLDMIPEPDLKAIIISGKGRHFSSGADLNELLQRVMNEFTEDREPEFLHHNSSVFNFFENLKIPVIAAIRGVCIGSGLELAMSCHFRFCEEGALLGLPESTFNLMPGCGGTQLLSRLVGFSKAVELILEGRNILPAEALSISLVDKITSRKQVLQFATKFALEFTAQKNTELSKSSLYCN